MHNSKPMRARLCLQLPGDTVLNTLPVNPTAATPPGKSVKKARPKVCSENQDIRIFLMTPLHSVHDPHLWGSRGL